MAQTKFRFAPSPNGFLHLGHAYSALLNQRLAREYSGALLLRLEDIDAARCPATLCDAAMEDLTWLGLEWDAPPVRQSERFVLFNAAQKKLRDDGLLYPCFCSRGDILRAIAGKDDWPRDPDGSPRYPGTCRALPPDLVAQRIAATEKHAWRLDMALAVSRTGPLFWREWSDDGITDIAADPLVWGDVILARKDILTSYHVAVVVDDAAQDITHVVRGVDLYFATAVHRVLQALLGLPAPTYRHHALVHDTFGEKLAKSKGSPALRTLRAAGVSAADVRARLGL